MAGTGPPGKGRWPACLPRARKPGDSDVEDPCVDTVGAQPGCLLASVSRLGCEDWDWDSSGSGNSVLRLLRVWCGLPATTGARRPGGLRLRQLVHSHVLPAGQASASLPLEGLWGPLGWGYWRGSCYHGLQRVEPPLVSQGAKQPSDPCRLLTVLAMWVWLWPEPPVSHLPAPVGQTKQCGWSKRTFKNQWVVPIQPVTHWEPGLACPKPQVTSPLCGGLIEESSSLQAAGSAVLISFQVRRC